jgi:hypothetical protein
MAAGPLAYDALEEAPAWYDEVTGIVNVYST